MAVSKSFLVNAVAAALIAGGIASCATEVEETGPAVAANTYVVCNAYNECWRVHHRYTTYPADQVIVYHDAAWWAAHQNDTTFHFEADPTVDTGYYDKDGVWHPFEPS